MTKTEKGKSKEMAYHVAFKFMEAPRSSTFRMLVDKALSKSAHPIEEKEAYLMVGAIKAYEALMFKKINDDKFDY